MFQDIPGVVAFLSAKDIPGKNSYVPFGLVLAFFEDEEEVCLICSYKREW
jgi:xanthine dehydrogenase molybdopterin-binding subunit B